MRFTVLHAQRRTASVRTAKQELTELAIGVVTEGAK